MNSQMGGEAVSFQEFPPDQRCAEAPTHTETCDPSRPDRITCRARQRPLSQHRPGGTRPSHNRAIAEERKVRCFCQHEWMPRHHLHHHPKLQSSVGMSLPPMHHLVKPPEAVTASSVGRSSNAASWRTVQAMQHASC